ncbi:MAG: phosphomannomutase/phosphoglucomutase [bacterium]
MAGIFKAYDIRGTYPDQLDEELAQKIGIAAGNFFGNGRIVVGHDMRDVAPPISDALTSGLRKAGQDVLDIGLCSSPMNYNAIGHYDAEGGVMVTASHNPPGYIGFKLSREEARPVSYESGIGELESAVNDNNLPEAGQPGTYEEVDFLPVYRDKVLEYAEDIDDLSVTVDTGNGMGGLTVPEVFGQLPLDVKEMYFELDGSFPNHIPNPLKLENTEELREEVSNGHYDFGVAFDGDADRAVFVDETGEIIPADLMTALLCSQMLDRSPGSSIIYDLRSSRVVPEEINAHGGNPVRYRVGHAYIKQKMRETDAVFGGELSGHYYFKRNFYTDCGLIAAVEVMNRLSSTDETLSELLEPLRRYSQSGEINFEVDDKQAAMEALEDHFDDGESDWLDGVTVQFEDWWFNVRPSNTEPVLRLNLEADNEALMNEKLDDVRSIIDDFT